MGFNKEFRKALGVSGLGEDRVQERTQGCWNCKHWDPEKAITLWWDQTRTAWLAKAAGRAVTHGENDMKVRGLRQTIPQIDAGMEQHVWGLCALNTDGGSEGLFKASTYMCDKWSGAVGASVAREGQAPDRLPAEIAAELDDAFTKDNN